MKTVKNLFASNSNNLLLEKITLILVFAMAILSNANSQNRVGIGTNRPVSNLSVKGTNNWDLLNTNGDFSIGDSVSSNNYRLKFGVALSGGGVGEGSIRASGGIGQLRLSAGEDPSGLYIRNTGKVGIGLSSPESRLEIRDGGLGISTSTKRYELNYDNSGYFYMDEFETGRHFVIKNGGNIGIGTTNPSNKLHIISNLSTVAKFKNTSSNTSKIVIEGTSDSLDIGVSDGFGVIGTINAAGIDFKTNNNVKMTLSVTGMLGIGTLNPTKAKLQIEGSASQTLASYGWLANAGTPTGVTNSNSTSYPYSILATHRIAASEFNAFSDSRIKKNKATSSYKNDMSILSNINVTNYQLIDSISKGNAQVKGFIAQQIEEVYPQAVSKIRDFVPDVYCLSSKVYKDKESNEITVEVNKSTSIKSGDKVKLIIEDKEIQVDILTVSDKSFSFKSDEKIGDKVFVYGKEVDDFRSIDYNQIFALGISGIQQLMKENENLNNKMTTIQTNFDELSTQVAEMKNMLEKKVSIGMK